MAGTSSWIDERLRLRLLPDNPYLPMHLVEARRQLGIPEAGFPDIAECVTWLETVFPTLAADAKYKMLSSRGRFWHWDSQLIWQALIAAPNPIKRQPLAEADKLRRAFQLPYYSVVPLFWAILLDVEPPVEELLDQRFIIEEDDLTNPDAVQEEFVTGTQILSKIPGTTLVFGIRVNDYTTQRDVDWVWEHIKRVRGKSLRRRRAGPDVEQGQIPEWVSWYRDWKAQGLTQDKVAEKYGLPFDTARYGLRQIDKLMKPTKG